MSIVSTTKRPNQTIALSGARVGLVIESPTYGQHVAIIDAADYALVEPLRWRLFARPFTNYARASGIDERGNKTQMYLHRYLLDAAAEVDHVDRNGLNNSRTNLRSVTRRENILNRHVYVNNKSGYRGVSWHRATARWQAFIGHNGRPKFLGAYTTAEDAARAYDVAATQLHGEFAQLNFPV